MLTNIKPNFTSSAAVYKGDAKKIDHLKSEFTGVTPFGDRFYNYLEVGNELWLPRSSCPMGEDLRVEGLDINVTSHFVPRDSEQATVAKQTAGHLKLGKSFITCAPTGFGKTFVGMDVVAEVKKKTLIVVTKEDIRDQWIDAAKAVLKLEDNQIGIVQADVFKTKNCPIVIALVQSVANLDKYSSDMFDDIGLVIWDECHRVGADYFSNSAFLFRAKLRLGLSATPKRKDGKTAVIEGHIGKVLVTTKQKKLVPKIICKKTPFKLPRVKRKINGVWKVIPLPHSPGKVGHINKMLAKDYLRNLLIVQFLMAAHGKGRNIIFFSAIKIHLAEIQRLLLKNGIPSKDISMYVGGLSKKARQEAKEARIILATYSYASEATDIPKLDTLVFGTPRSDVVQIVGRIRRVFEDKKDPVVFDPIDFDSKVFLGYHQKRLRWYQEIGAEIHNY